MGSNEPLVRIQRPRKHVGILFAARFAPVNGIPSILSDWRPFFEVRFDRFEVRNVNFLNNVELSSYTDSVTRKTSKHVVGLHFLGTKRTFYLFWRVFLRLRRNSDLIVSNEPLIRIQRPQTHVGAVFAAGFAPLNGIPYILSDWGTFFELRFDRFQVRNVNFMNKVLLSLYSDAVTRKSCRRVAMLHLLRTKRPILPICMCLFYVELEFWPTGIKRTPHSDSATPKIRRSWLRLVSSPLTGTPAIFSVLRPLLRIGLTVPRLGMEIFQIGLEGHHIQIQWAGRPGNMWPFHIFFEPTLVCG